LAEKKSTAWDGLEALDLRVRAARSRESEVRVRSGEAARRVKSAQAALSEYQEAVFVEERPEDAAEERRLIEAIRDAEAAASQPVTDARMGAAARAREAAEAELERFESQHFEELLRDHAPEAYAATEELETAYRAREAAERRYAIAQRRSFRLASIGGRSSHDVPRNPLAGEPGEVVDRFARGIEPPLPRSLVRAYLEPVESE
jgi:hypothetical protein